MLNGLCTGAKAAGCVFDALKTWRQPGATNNISWDHFYGSIQQYSMGLKQVTHVLYAELFVQCVCLCLC